MAGSKGGGERRDREQHYRRAALAHPVRRGILRLLLDGMEAGAVEIAAELTEAPGRIAHHLRRSEEAPSSERDRQGPARAAALPPGATNAVGPQNAR